jgi:hypothetical protein
VNSKGVKKVEDMKILNSKSILKCDEYEEIEHNNELMEIGERISDLKDFDCAVLKKYQDEYSKNKDMEILHIKLWDIFDLAEYVDCKNGADLHLDNDGFLNMSVYGQIYKYRDEFHIKHCAFKIMPYDGHGNFLNIGDYVLGKGPVKISKETFSEYEKDTKPSTLDALRKYENEVAKKHKQTGKEKRKKMWKEI